MDFNLGDEHRLIQQTVRDFATGEVAPVAEELDREHRFPYEIVAKLAELNLMGIPFPQEYGGGGGDSRAHALPAQPVYLFGSEEQKQEWMPRLCAGEILGAFGLTEPEAGSDAGNVRTRARLDGGEW